MKWPLFFLIILFNTACGQQKVTIIVDQYPEKKGETLFLAGNFNMWNPGHENFKFYRESGKQTIHIQLEKGNYEYKITRGNWQTVEENRDFKPMGNRKIVISSDTVIHITIGAWADDRPGGNKLATNTASPQVHIMDTAYYMPQLNRNRRIWIYLPKGYEQTNKRYPVLYMHDGQNVFDAATSFSGEWGVDEFLDSLGGNCREAIVVAIDNGQSYRMNEYNPWEFMEFGKGEGDQYVDFLIKDLKPYIDKHYRTLPGKKSTSIAGSSMGGLISLYAVLKYPKVFGSAGIFSPAFWTAKGIDSTVVKKAKKMNSKLYFYAGGKESESMIPDMVRIEKEISKYSKSQLKELTDADAQHNEAAWRKYFPDFYKWVFCK
ncbi:MAG: alpha/beta hydrolase [Chitinophagaceae bacterium]|nr:alpha/beta hydrolase [Chitinophagaceae bacterium]